MVFTPFSILSVWLRSLLSLALLGGGIYLFAQWYQNREVVVTVPDPDGGVRQRVVPREFGLNRETAFLLGGLALTGWSVGGGRVGGSRLRRRVGGDEPHGERRQARPLRLPDGSSVCLEEVGPADGPTVVFTHGWGLDGDAWYYARRELGNRHRVVSWDLPGLGESERPADGDWDLERLAARLDAVVRATGDRPVVLVGHSIGSMIVLTYCRLFPRALGTRVRGIVLVHGTYTNPLRTMRLAALATALQKPVVEPLCHLMVWLSPLVRLLNVLSYLNGSVHRSVASGCFAGGETRGQLDFLSRYYLTSPPDVVARGMLAMLRYDATDVLARIPVPALVVAGDQDSTCLPEASRHMAATIPHARLLTLSPARHCGQVEHHQAFHAAVAEFAAACLPAAEAAGAVPHAPAESR